MKIGIRVSILTLFVSLLVLLGSVILGVNYFTSNKVLLEFAGSFLQATSKNIGYKSENFLETIHSVLNYNTKLIQRDIITPDFSDDFMRFLISILEERPSFYAIHWSKPNGDLVLLEKRDDGNFNNYIVSHNQKNIYERQRIVDHLGKAIGKTTNNVTKLDPRMRPWYKMAIVKRQYVISDLFIYYFFNRLCFVGAQPLYEKNGALRGILGITVMAKSLTDFVTELKVTKNSTVFIFDNKTNLIAAKVLRDYNESVLLNVSNLEPSVYASFKQYQKDPRQLFFYSYAEKEYIAFYESMQSEDSPESLWTVAITLPVSDIIGTLVMNFIVSAAVILVVLLMSILLVWIFSNAISKPIIRLSQEAVDIKQMDFSHLPVIKSRIKEVTYMQDSFYSMVQSIKSFIRYIPFTLVKKLVGSGKIASVGGEYKNITLMFTDITGFTSLSENMPPEELTFYLSEYFEAMTKAILANKGTIDKYIGDGIMAFWGAPLEDENHALHACRSALAMLEILPNLNKHWQTENKPELLIRVGINTGSVIVGNIGSEDKLSYTAIGDGVNLTSRLQDLNKTYKTTVVVSQSTYELVKDNKDLFFRFLDSTAVRGKHESINIYELLHANNPLSKVLDQYHLDFMKAFNAYQEGDWLSAITLLERIKNQYPEDHLAEIFLARCFRFQNNPPENWDGVWRY